MEDTAIMYTQLLQAEAPIVKKSVLKSAEQNKTILNDSSVKVKNLPLYQKGFYQKHSLRPTRKTRPLKLTLAELP